MKDFEKLIKKYNTFAIFTHINPDGDALGSSNALKLALKSLSKKAYIYADGVVSSTFDFLKVTLEHDEKFIAKADVCVLVDCNNLDRIGKYAKIYDEKAKVKACIDHHQRENCDFSVSYVDPQSPSTADLIYEMFKDMNLRITKDIATNLYTGLATDTGCFKHANTNISSHRHAYELLNYNFDLEEANYKLFKHKPSNHLDFYKSALQNTHSFLNNRLFVVHMNYRSYLRFKEICDNSASFQFLDGVDGNEIQVKIIEKKRGVYHLSFRSNLYANVCDLARIFGGGGHIKASGATFQGKYKEILNKIIQESEKLLEPEKEEKQ